MTGGGVGSTVWTRLVISACFCGCEGYILTSAQSGFSCLRADGGGNQSTRSWLSNWGLGKMSYFSKNLNSVGKYIRKIKLDTIVPHSKVPPPHLFL